MSLNAIPRGLPIVLSAPSGGGKSTIADHVLRNWSQVVRSISCTTRPPRPGEANGRDYFFLTEEEFKSKIADNEFVEWAEVHGRYYGTPKGEFEKNLDLGKDVLLVIDPQGAVAIKKMFADGIYIFVVPPTWEDLSSRLTDRGTDAVVEREKRLSNAKTELSYLPYYDFLVVNDNLDSAVGDVLAIIRSEHRRLRRVNKADIPIFSEFNL